MDAGLEPGGLDNRAAIVGVGCRLPGGISSLDQLGAALFAGRDLVTEVPPDRFDRGLWCGDGAGRSYTGAGGFLRDVTGFDAGFFEMSPREAAQTDPQQRLLLEMAVEAFDHAGIDPATTAGGDGGVWIGTSTRGYWELMSARPEAVGAHSMLGTITGNASNRLSFQFDWRGPSWSIDTACSSALVALHQAARAVASGEVRTALAGGIGLLLNPVDYLGFARASVLSPTGRCHAFSERADGFVRGEGGGVVLLKRLDDAIAAGDRVLAVVAGSGTNVDGRSVSVMSQPSRVTQQALLERVYAEAGVEPDDLVYLECHGTGTPVGDPVECDAIGAALGTRRTTGRPLPIGSVKTNVGHLECASGVAGLLKALVVLGSGRIPPSLHGSPLNPAIDFDGLGLLPTDREIPVGRAGGRAATGVNSFGIGGANAHVVLTEPAPEHIGPVRTDSPPSGRLPVLVSARTPEALNEAAWAMAEHLEDGTGGFYDTAYTSLRRRRRHEHAAVVFADDAAGAARGLYGLSSGTPPAASAVCEEATVAGGGPDGAPIGFVFGGNGAQWVGMGASLLGDDGAASDPAFTAAVADVDAHLSPLLGWSVAGALAAGDYDLGPTEIAQPLLFAVQVGLLAALRERGVRPAMVAGHSVGEIAAGHAAGILDLAAACRVVAVRSAAQGRTAGAGMMAAAAVGADEVAELIASCGIAVEVSAVNSPTDVTLSGDRADLERLGGVLADRGVFFRMLALDYAFHSAAMDPIRTPILTGLAGLPTSDPALPMFSTVTGALVPDGAALGAGYWWDNIREPVRMADATAAMASAGAGVVLEIGPHPVLGTYLRRISRSSGSPSFAVAGTLRRDEEPDVDAAVAAVLAAGGAVDTTTWFPVPGRVTDLPAYPWQQERLWIGDPSWWGHGPGDGTLVHPLLGERVAVPAPQWEGTVETSQVPWLSGHEVAGAIVMPGAAFAEMALSAGPAVVRDHAVRVTNLAVTAGLTMPPPGDPVQVRLSTAITGDTVTISSRRSRLGVPPQPWIEHARGRLRPVTGSAPQALDTAAIRARLDDTMDRDAFYAMSTRAGTVYGTDFRALTDVWFRCDPAGRGELLGEYRMPDRPATEMTGPAGGRYAAHPVLLDVALHAGGPLLSAVRDGSMLFVPVEFGALTVWGPPPTQGVVHVVSRSEAGREAVWDVTLAGTDGTVALTMTDLRFRLIEGRPQPASGVWSVTAQEAGSDIGDTAAAPGSWTVLGDAGGRDVARRLAGALSAGEPAPVRPGDLAPWRDAVRWATTGDGPAAVALVLSEPDGDPLAAGTDAGQMLRDLTLAWQERLTAAPDARLTFWLVTGPCGVTGDAGGSGAGGTAAAAAWGTARTIANEIPGVVVRRVAVEPSLDVAGAGRVAVLLATDPGREDEFVVGPDTVRVPRVVPHRPVGSGGARVGADAPARSGTSVGGATALQVRTIALTPQFGPAAIPVPEPGPGQVLIEVRAAALNYKDVMLATGLMPIEPPQADWRTGHNAGPLIGQECAGVVVRTGAGVAGLRQGQAVMAIAPGTLASHVCADAAVTVPIPDGLAFTEAATMPLVFATAHYGLNDLAGMEPGETLLLPGGAGGVGLAALTLARLAGVDVVALAGTPAKRELLLRRGARYALDSRSAGFADEVRELTGGRGVDVVLNSLTGPAATACLELLAPDGRFVEVGKRDLYEDAGLRLRPFLNTLSYFAVDLAQLIERRPGRAGRVLRDVADMAGDGRIAPLPHTVHPASDLEQAFETLKRSEHVGKLVIDTTGIASQRVAFDPDGAYLVTGGTAGFGAATARWLADHGAGHVVVTGRRPPERAPDHPAVTAVAADVTDPVAMADVVAAARAAAHGLRGVFHCAAGYDDGPLEDQDAARYAGVLGPKVAGALVLDELTRDCDLDHFVLYSSVSALFGNRLQASYSAANLCLETLARRRREGGAPALAVAWGAIAGTGVVVRDDLAESMARLGLEPMPPAEALDRLGTLLVGDAPHSALIARVDWERAGLMFPAGAAARFSELVTSSVDGGRAGGSLREQLHGRKETEAQEVAVEAVTGLVAAILRTEPDRLSMSAPLNRLGIDSILATELAVTMRRELDVEIPTLEILGSQGVGDLASRALVAAGGRPDDRTG